jgi:hypothetical protein
VFVILFGVTTHLISVLVFVMLTNDCNCYTVKAVYTYVNFTIELDKTEYQKGHDNRVNRQLNFTFRHMITKFPPYLTCESCQPRLDDINQRNSICYDW